MPTMHNAVSWLPQCAMLTALGSNRVWIVFMSQTNRTRVVVFIHIHVFTPANHITPTDCANEEAAPESILFGPNSSGVKKEKTHRQLFLDCRGTERS